MSIPALVDSGRRMVASTLLDQALVFDETQVPDSSGGTHVTFVQRTVSVPCRFGPLTDTERMAMAGTTENPATAALLVPLGTELTEGTRVRPTGAPEWASGNTWVVVAAKTPPSHLAVVERLWIREL